MSTYTVVSGDTLGGIAQHFNTTTDTLVQLNKIVNPDQIFPGQVLQLPNGAGNAATSSPAAAWAFSVGPGIAEAMRQDHTTPATDEVFQHGIGPDVQWSEAIGENGVVYRWIKATNQVHRFRPS